MTEENDFPERLWFTPLLNRIADVAGDKAAIQLGHEKAGQIVYIPGTVLDDHWLTALVGREAAQALVESFSGQKLEIPPAIGGDRRRRSAAIAEMIDKGYSNNTIAKLTGVARTTIKQHRRKHHKDDGQGSLF